MTVVLAAVAGLLALWGFYSLTIFENIAAVDVGSRIIVGAAIVLGLAAVTRALDRLRRDLVQAAETPRDHLAVNVPELAMMPDEPQAPVIETAAVPARVEKTPPTAPVEPLASAAPPPAPVRPVASVAPPAEPKAPPVRSPFAPPVGDVPERPVPDFLTRASTAAPVAAAAATIAASAAVAATVSAKEEQPASSEPALLREGLLNGVNYRFYSDGSVEAEGANGPQRYASVNELRDEILSRRVPAETEASAPASEDREEATETVRPRPFEPLVSDHVRSDDLYASSDEPVESDIPVIRASRTDGISDHNDAEPVIGEIDRGLEDADVSFEAAENDLTPTIDVPFEDTLEEEGLFYSRESELGYDEPAVEQDAPERGDRWSEAIRMLLRRDRGDTQGNRDVNEEPGGFDDTIDFGDRSR